MQYNSGSLLLVLLILGDTQASARCDVPGCLYRNYSKPQVGLHSSGRQHLPVCMQPVMSWRVRALYLHIPDDLAVQIRKPIRDKCSAESSRPGDGIACLWKSQQGSGSTRVHVRSINQTKSRSIAALFCHSAYQISGIHCAHMSCTSKTAGQCFKQRPVC